MLRRVQIAVLTTTCVVGIGLPLAPAQAGGTSSVSGVAFADSDRDGALDAGEPTWSDQVIYLFDSTGAYVGNARTDSTGRYAFGGLPTGTYTVAYSSLSWNPIRQDWVPTTGTSLRPSATLTLTSDASVDFGWRPIAWSTQLGSPMSRTVTASGTQVESYNDAVTAEHVAQMLTSGGLVGEEASATTVRVAYGTTDQTVTSSAYDGTRFSSYSASVYVTWGSWLSNAASTLFHEYGHAWSLYFAHMAQNDPDLTGYLQARGLVGDTRVDSGYGWDRRELIAEDYRQLFGDAAARLEPQANRELPPAASVSGLEDYLRTTFRTGSATTAPPDTQEPAPAALTISDLQMSRVTKSGTASFTLSTSATVSLRITTTSGALVKSLLLDGNAAAGTVSALWDRTTDKGQRVKNGTYLLVATARSSDETTSEQVPFSVG